jgi:hypothetical protein
MKLPRSILCSVPALFLSVTASAQTSDPLAPGAPPVQPPPAAAPPAPPPAPPPVAPPPAAPAPPGPGMAPPPGGYGPPPPQPGYGPPPGGPPPGPPPGYYGPPPPQGAYGQPPPPPPAGNDASLVDSRIAVGIERAFGFYHWNATVEPGGGIDDIEMSGNMLSLLYGSATVGDGDDGVNPFAIPRVAVDAILGGLTLGGSLGFISTSGEEQQGDTSEDYDDTTGFAIYPRVGFIIESSDVLSIWLRGGVEYYSATSDDGDTEDTLSLMSISLEPALVITPVPNVGFLISGLAAIGVSGTREVSTDGASSEADVKFSTFGLNAGLTAFF